MRAKFAVAARGGSPAALGSAVAGRLRGARGQDPPARRAGGWEAGPGESLVDPEAFPRRLGSPLCVRGGSGAERGSGSPGRLWGWRDSWCKGKFLLSRSCARINEGVEESSPGEVEAEVGEARIRGLGWGRARGKSHGNAASAKFGRGSPRALVPRAPEAPAAARSASGSRATWKRPGSIYAIPRGLPLEKSRWGRGPHPTPALASGRDPRGAHQEAGPCVPGPRLRPCPAAEAPKAPPCPLLSQDGTLPPESVLQTPAWAPAPGRLTDARVAPGGVCLPARPVFEFSRGALTPNPGLFGVRSPRWAPRPPVNGCLTVPPRCRVNFGGEGNGRGREYTWESSLFSVPKTCLNPGSDF